MAQLTNPQALLNPEAGDSIRTLFAQLPGGAQAADAFLQAIRIALAASLHDLFLAGAFVTGIGLVIVLFLREIPLNRPLDAPRSAAAPPKSPTAPVTPAESSRTA
jgi:hypothetical protein